MVVLTKVWKKVSSPLSWQWYRDFFALSFLRYMATWFAIVPAVAGILISVPERVTLPFTSPPTIITLTLPFAWQVLWFGSVCFLLAFVIYLGRAPVFVRRYHSLDDYLGKGHSPRWISWESKYLFDWDTGRDKFVDRLKKKGYLAAGAPTPQVVTVEVAKDTTDFKFTHDGSSYVLSMPIMVDGIEDGQRTTVAVREIFWEIFGRYAESRVIARRAIQALLFMSLISVISVTLQHIATTLLYIFGAR